MSNAKIIAELEIVGVENFNKELVDSKKAAVELTNSVKGVGNDGTKAIDTLTKSSGSLRTQLRNARQAAAETLIELNKLKESGKESAEEIARLEAKFKELTNTAGKLDDVMKDASAAISQAGSDTRGIDIAIRGLTTLSAGFQLTEAGAALFGEENEELQKTLVKLNAIMAATNALQQIGQELTREDSILTNIASKAKGAYALAVGASTGAMKLFRVALAATGIGLIIPLIAALVANFDKIGAVLFKIFPSISKFGSSFSEIKDKVVAFVKNGLLNYINSIVEVYNTSLLARQAVSAIGATFKSVGDVVITVAKNMITVFSTLYKAITNPREIVSTLKGGFNEIVDNYKNLGKNIVDNYTSGFENAKKSQLKKLTFDDLNFGGDDAAKTAKTEGEKAGSKYVEGFADATDKAAAQGLTKLKEQLAQLEEAYKKLVDVEVESGRGIAGNEVLKNASKEVDTLRYKIEELERQLQNINKVQGTTESIKVIKLDKIEVPKVNNIDVYADKLKVNPNKIEPPKESKIDIESLFGISKDNFEKEADFRLSIASKLFENIASLSQKITGTISSFNKNIIEGEQQRYEELRTKGLISERNYQRQMANIKNDAARRQRRAEIAQAAVNVPIAILSAFTSTAGGIVVKAIAAGVAGSFAAAQLAAIIKKPIPQFYKGTKKAPAGFKWVGERGPELINDRGGYAIINNEDSNKLTSLYDKYNIPTKTTKQKSSNSIDIEKAIDRANYKLLKALRDKGVVIENVNDFANLLTAKKYV